MINAPVAQEELPILEAVINIRNRLTALKRDRAEYIKPSEVNALYQAVVKQVTKLNDVRDDNTTYNNCRHHPCRRVQSVIALLSHARKDKGMSRSVFTAGIHAANSHAYGGIGPIQ